MHPLSGRSCVHSAGVSNSRKHGMGALTGVDMRAGKREGGFVPIATQAKDGVFCFLRPYEWKQSHEPGEVKSNGT